jgi:hypothetical protein
MDSKYSSPECQAAWIAVLLDRIKSTDRSSAEDLAVLVDDLESVAKHMLDLLGERNGN